MSNQVERFKHSKRLQKKITKIQRKMKIAKAYGYQHILANPHRYSKQSMFHCGNASCVMCGNPRKVFEEKTRQERSFEQTKKWTDE
jgi:hypothetical protein